MTSLFEPPVSHVVAAGLVIFGAWAAVRGARRVSDGLAGGAALELVRGVRLAIFAIVAGFFAIGLVSARSGFVTFGALILAEELYETGVLALLCRLGERDATAAGPGTDPAPMRPPAASGSIARAVCHTAICSARSTS